MTRYPLYILFALASLVLVARVVAGPFDFLLPVHSPLNAEALIAVSFLLALMLRSRRLQRVVTEPFAATAWPWVLTGSALLVAGAFSLTITAPLLHDSYIHVQHSATMTFSQVLRSVLIHPIPGDLFFRPLGYISYWIDYRRAGANPAFWHS